MRIVVAGGAGRMGCAAVRDLAHSPAVTELVVADRSLEQARLVAGVLGNAKISAVEADVQDHEVLVRALRGADCCLNAAPYTHNVEVMGACLEAGVPYTDLGGLFHTTRKQLQLHEQFQKEGIPAVLGAGSAPGVSNVQACYAAAQLDTVDAIHIYDGILPPPPDTTALGYALPTLLDQLTLPPIVYRDGDLAACAPLGEGEEAWFAPPIGVRRVHLSLHSGVATLPLSLKDKGVREVWFKINGWGMAPELVARLQSLIELGFAGQAPVVAGETTVVPRDLLLALLGPLAPPVSTFLQPPGREPPDWVEEIRTEVVGTRYGRPVTLRLSTWTVQETHLAGASASITAQWLAEGRIPPGVHPPETVLEPVPFFTALHRRGFPTQIAVAESIGI